MKRITPILREILQIRRRISWERLLRGLGLVAVVVVAASVLAALILARQNFSDSALFWVRTVALLGLGLLLVRYLLLPLFRRPSTRRTARFLEERHPDLQDRLSTAVEIAETPGHVHPAIRRLIEGDAQGKLRQMPRPAFYFRRSSLLSLLGVVASVLIFAVLFLGGPEAYRYSLDKLVWGWMGDEQPPLYAISVKPGDSRIVRHADLEIRAQLNGFTSESVKLWAKYANRPDWESVQMRPDPEGSDFVFPFFDVRDSFQYYVESEGIRSDVFNVEVSEIPSIEKLQVTLNYPRYTGLKPATQEDEGDIRALKGTEAVFSLQIDQPVMAGRIELEDGGEIALERSEPQRLTGSFKVSQNDFYRIHLQNMEEVWSPASDEFVVEALEDEPVTITFDKPGRDLKVTNLEEIFLQVSAEDDFGVRDLTLYYSVNGEPDQELVLDAPRWARRATSSHTLYLEEYDLEPGDFISYFARARDARSVAQSDIYFLDVQPYDREYRQSQQAGGGGGAGGEDLILSRFQKEIISATFNVLRDQAGQERKEFEENTQTIALMQQQLQTQAQTIVDRIERRGAATSGEMFQKMVEFMKEAIIHMGEAHANLNQFQAEEAFQPEKKAYQQLLRAEALFKEIQIAMGGGGSQGGGSNAEDLADLVDLELDKTKNQYETLQQNRQNQRDEQLDDAARKLKELAARQQQEMERRRKGMPSSSSGGGSQQQLLEEIEELARQLERLSRQKRDQRLNQVSNQLRQAARDLRRSQSGQATPEQAQMMAEQAAQRLQKARQELDRSLQNQRSGEMEQLASQAQELAQRQRDVVQGLEQLEQKQQAQQLDDQFFRQLQNLLGEKESLQDDLRRLETDLHQNARRLASAEPEAARELKEAGNRVRDQRVLEKMEEGSALLRQTWAGLAREREALVSEELEKLAEDVSQARQAMGKGRGSDTGERAEEALSQLGNLVEDLNSLTERAENRGQGPQAGEQGESGEPRQNAQGEQSQQPGQEGQQGQQGQQGQEGQQGRQGEQGQQGQQGQEGQRGQPGQRTQGQPAQQGGSESGPPSLSANSRQIGQQSSPFANSGGINPQQAEREWTERIRDAERIRDLLRGVDPAGARDINSLARMMRQIDASRIFNDPDEVARLKEQIINGFREVELQVYSKLQKSAKQQLRLTHEDEVPPQFRDRVEDYYRALAGQDKPR